MPRGRNLHRRLSLVVLRTDAQSRHQQGDGTNQGGGQEEGQNADHRQNHYQIRHRGLRLEGSDSGAKSRHVGQGLRDRRHGSWLQVEALSRASRHGRRRTHAGDNQRIPRRLPAGDRKRQQGCERQLVSWRQPARRLRPRARGRSREPQGRDPSGAIRLEHRAVEVDRCAREGTRDRPPVPRSRPATCRADRWPGICRQARRSEGETRGVNNEKAPTGRRGWSSARDETRNKSRIGDSIQGRMTSLSLKPNCARTGRQGRRLATASLLVGLLTLIAAIGPADAASGRRQGRVEFMDARTAGEPVIAVVSLRSQQITVYDAKGWIVRAPVSSSQKGRETPAGIFSIIQKNREHYSSLYDDAYMPHMQRITWSGIALHGGVLPGHAASHGCVRMPYAFAAHLFDATRVGMRVIVAPHDMTPVEIAHPSLPSAKTAPAALASSRSAF